jgi:hypothetical protein
MTAARVPAAAGPIRSAASYFAQLAGLSHPCTPLQ